VSAEDWLASLDPIGWRFGLERIEALLDALGDPQLQFESIHVVGTNGKSSVTQMAAALLEASGRTTGAYLSPHTERWAERVRIRGAEIDADPFERAVGAVAAVVPEVEEGFEEGERVTQFEAATAAAFVALSNAGIEVGVIEAGLGGRLDATNVLDSSVTALTSIGLDHTQWLGETELEIAAEKLAVLRPGTALVLGGVSPEVAASARAHAANLDSRVVEALPEGETSNVDPYRGAIGTFRSHAPYLRRNLAVAVAAAETFLGGSLGDDVLTRALEDLDLPGRFELVDGDPPVVRDAAHNPDGAAALAEALKAELGERTVVACLAVLGDKDAAGIVRALAPALSAAVVTEIPSERLEGSGRPGTTSTPMIELGRLCEAAGLPTEGILDPSGAIAWAFERAKEADGVALIAGSHYLLSY
jgi:dihydrofolate synthase / folylpolyglutamate synthase